MGIKEEAEEDFGKFVRDNVLPFAPRQKRAASQKRPNGSIKINGAGQSTIVNNSSHVAVTHNHYHHARQRVTVRKTADDGVHISEAQGARIQQLANDIVAAGGGHYSKVYSALKRRFQVTSYALLPIGAFSDAENYLVRWIARLGPKPGAEGDSAAAERKRHISFIKVRQKKSGKTEDERRELMSRVVQKTSLRECSLAELTAVRQAVTREWSAR